jgi:hypothetical protein
LKFKQQDAVAISGIMLEWRVYEAKQKEQETKE